MEEDFRYGDRVGYYDTYLNEWFFGEVTVVRNTEVKVIFDYKEDREPQYWYYPKTSLTKVGINKCQSHL